MDTSSEIRMETMCVCVPLRLGVLLGAALTFITSVLFLLDREHYQASYRHYGGGYAFATQMVGGLFVYSGLIFGLVGVVGTYQCNRDYLKVYNLWQAARLLAYVPMYTIDIPMLRTCELWVNDIERMTQDKGWNPVMYNIALHGECPSERIAFFADSFLCCLFIMYIAWGSFKYQDFMDRTPKHLLRMPKGGNTSSFAAYGSGERTPVTGVPFSVGAPPNIMMQPGGAMMTPPGVMMPVGPGSFLQPPGACALPNATLSPRGFVQPGAFVGQPVRLPQPVGPPVRL